MIELHYWPTPNGHKVAIALEEMGLDYELETMPFPPRLAQPEFLEVNELGTIP
ncbi:MAG: glutathione S-transferase N-terminal domain-containing protein, partial [Candidatus Puniceispirillales bacterium]